MSNPIPTEFRIGGELACSPDNRDDVLELLREMSDLSIEPGDVRLGDKMSAAHLKIATEDNEGVLVLHDQTRDWGDTESVQNLCRKLGLPFDFYTEADCDCEPTWTFWRPGMDEPVVWNTDVNRHRVFRSEKFVEVMNILNNGTDLASRIKQAQCFVTDLVDAKPEALPAFSYSGEWPFPTKVF